jgi:hypothetical protein
MSFAVAPFGVLAALYLREYAREGLVVRIVRIAVNNLAGVPSIVFGVFGLGFFVYLIGGGIDRIFFPEALPTPTFGTGGILWASLTLALLTVPVVIVATEEGLAAVPRVVRADRSPLSVRAPGAQVHAPRLSHLRRRLSEPQRRGHPTARLRHGAAARHGGHGDESDRHRRPQSTARRKADIGTIYERRPAAAPHGGYAARCRRRAC